MMRVGRSSVVLGCLLLALSVGVSCASSRKKTEPVADLTAGIEREVADAGRASVMLESVDEMKALTSALASLVAEEREALIPMIRDYSTPRTTFEARFAEFDERRTALALRMLDAHLAIKGAATAGEWKKLRKAERRALQQFAAESLGREALLVGED